MADAAHAFTGNIAANAAKRNPVADTSKRLLEAVDIFRFCVQNVEGDPLGTFRPNPRQAREFVDEVLSRTFEHLHSTHEVVDVAIAHAL